MFYKLNTAVVIVPIPKSPLNAMVNGYKASSKKTKTAGKPAFADSYLQDIHIGANQIIPPKSTQTNTSKPLLKFKVFPKPESIQAIWAFLHSQE